ncbi:hypothetical protein HQ587_10475 [bacterium]|nr:hypothetical protein [bacterium]
MIFWSIWFGLILILISISEMVFGYGFLFNYLSGNLLLSLCFIFFGGMLVDMVVKINLPLRLLYGADYILKERAVIRNTRKATNLALVVGFAFCLYYLKPRLFFIYFPTYLIIMGWFLVLSWSIVGIFLDQRMVEDVRFRFYMDRLGITSLKRYRKFGAFIIGTLFITAIGFWILMRIPGLWEEINNLAVVGSVLYFTREYLSWLF